MTIKILTTPYYITAKKDSLWTSCIVQARTIKEGEKLLAFKGCYKNEVRRSLFIMDMDILIPFDKDANLNIFFTINEKCHPFEMNMIFKTFNNNPYPVKIIYNEKVKKG